METYPRQVECDDEAEFEEATARSATLENFPQVPNDPEVLEVFLV